MACLIDSTNPVNIGTSQATTIKIGNSLATITSIGTTTINDGANLVTKINTGTSTGAVHISDGTGLGTVNIGNSTGPTTVAVVGTTTINDSAGALTTKINTGTSTGAITIGNTSGGNLTVSAPQTIIGSNNASALIVNNGTTNNNAVAISTNGTNPILTIGSTGLATSGDITLNGKTSGFTRIQTPDTAGSYTLKLPTILNNGVNPLAQQNVLTTDSTGIMYNFNKLWVDTGGNTRVDGNLFIASSAIQLFTNGQAGFVGNITGNSNLTMSSTNSTTKFDVKDNAGNHVFTVDTSGNNVNIGANIANTGNTFNMYNSAGALINQIGSTGNVLIQPSLNAVNAFQIKNSGNTGILAVDTSTPAINLSANTILSSGSYLELQNNSQTVQILASASATASYVLLLPPNKISSNPVAGHFSTVLVLDQTSGQINNPASIYTDSTGILTITAGLNATGSININTSGVNGTNIGTSTNSGGVSIGGSSSAVTLGGNTTISTQITSYNGLTPDTTALSVPIIVKYGNVSLTADGNVFTSIFTVPGGNTTYTLFELVSGFEITAWTAGTISMTLAFTDMTNTALTAYNLAGTTITDLNVSATNQTTLGSTGVMTAYAFPFRAQGGSTITLAIKGITTATVKAWGTLRQLAATGS